jgi:hypothetical protein
LAWGANGEIVEGYWLTNLPSCRISRRSLYAMAKSRWQIENQGFNDAKNRYGLEQSPRRPTTTPPACSPSGC